MYSRPATKSQQTVIDFINEHGPIKPDPIRDTNEHFAADGAMIKLNGNVRNHMQPDKIDRIDGSWDTVSPDDPRVITRFKCHCIEASMFVTPETDALAAHVEQAEAQGWYAHK